MKKIFLTILLLPLVSLAQAGELNVGDKNVAYDSVSEKEAVTLYYQGETLVASESDGVTLVYENDVLALEAHDTDGDGKLDAFLTLDSNEEVTSMTGEGVSAFERPETVEFEDLIAEGGSEAAAEEDLVGSLDSITIPGSGLPWLPIIIVLLAAVGGYRFYKKRKMAETEL